MYYNKCPACGANLDPGEHCDCETTKKKISLPRQKRLIL